MNKYLGEVLILATGGTLNLNKINPRDYPRIITKLTEIKNNCNYTIKQFKKMKA